MSYKSVIIRDINAFLIVLFPLLALSCAGSKHFTDEKLMVSMEKTPCYGYCPVYTIQIDSEGNGTFQGVENTDLIGKYSFHLEKSDVELIRSLFENTGFFDLEDKYYQNVTDLPTTYVRYRSGDRDKKITDYYGAPRALKDLEKQLESFVLSSKMKKLE